MATNDELQKVIPVDRPLDAPTVAAVRPSRGSSSAQVKVKTAAVATPTDPFAGGKWKRITAFTNILTFLLLATDVPRSGVKTDASKLKPIGQGVWNFFGPFAYPVSYFHSQPGNSTVVTSADMDGHEILTTRRAWSYKFDTTSISLRAIAGSLEAPPGSVTSKLTYRSPGLNPVETFPAVDAFHFLDDIMDAVADPMRDLPVIHPSASAYQRTRFSGVAKTRRTDLLYDYLSHQLVDRVEVRAVRASHFNEIEKDGSFDLCEFPRDRPFVCDAGVLSDLKKTVMLSEQDTRKIGFIGDHATQLIRDVVARASTNYSNPKGTLTVDAAFFDAYARPQTFSGGLVMAAKAEFELVLLTRIRDCTSSGCQTLFLGDYRYEAARFLSDFVDWNALVSAFRVTAQVYILVRLIALVVAIYVAYPPGERSAYRSLRLLLCEVPSHIVAYGSSLPVVLYAVAHCIDASMTQMTLFARLLKIQGSVEKDEWEVFQIVCLLMRCQWLMGAAAWLWVLIQTSLQGWRRHNGVVSVRGHVFGIVASMTVILGYRKPIYRDNRILELADENPATSVMLASITLRELSIQRLGGVFSDILSIMFCSLIYGAVLLILRYLHFHVQRITKPQLTVQSTARKLEANVFNEKTGLFFSETKRLPSTCGVLWAPAALSCAWGGDLVLSLPGLEGHDATAQRFMLMNIVFMSDPLTYLSIRYGFHSTLIVSYEEPETGRVFALAENPEIDDQSLLDEKAPWKNVSSVDSSFSGRKYQLVHKKPAYSVPFHELVRCR